MGGEPVMDVHRGERDDRARAPIRRERIEQHDRIAAAGERDDDARGARGRLSPRDRIEQRVPDGAQHRSVGGGSGFIIGVAPLVASGTVGRPPRQPAGISLNLPYGEDLVLARLEQRVERLILQRAQRFGQRLLERHHHRRGVAVRAARRLVDDLVDQPELLQARRGDAERLGGLGRLLGRLPQDRRAALGRDHRVGRVLEHQRDVADRDRERAARAAFADDRHDDRHAQARPSRRGCGRSPPTARAPRRRCPDTRPACRRT